MALFCFVQVGFGLYPVVVKKYVSEKKADPLVFSFYRDLCCFPLLFLCALIAERTVIFPRIKMLMVKPHSTACLFDDLAPSPTPPGICGAWFFRDVW